MNNNSATYAPLADLLTDCPVCSAKASRMAPTCPGCGHPIKPTQQLGTEKNGITITGIQPSITDLFVLSFKLFIAFIPIALISGWILAVIS